MTTDTTTPKPTLEQEIAERFARDTGEHVMTVLHDDGLYRHLRCTREGSSLYWFEIVTWPGSLAIRGDIGNSYVFSRTTDMFEFFRPSSGWNSGRINPGYWSEKLADSGRSVKTYSEDRLRECLAEVLAEYEQEYAEARADYEHAQAEYDALPSLKRWPFGPREPVEPPSPESYRERIAEYDEDGLLSFEEHARNLLGSLESDGIVSDTWEWDLNDWDWPYLWACHAVVWAISRYDAAKAAGGGEPR